MRNKDINSLQFHIFIQQIILKEVFNLKLKSSLLDWKNWNNSADFILLIFKFYLDKGSDMSSTIFERGVWYTERVVNNHSKRIKLPNFKYLYNKLHPKYKDHIVVLSTHNFPDNVNVTTNAYDPNIYGIYDMDSKYSEKFK